IGCIGMHETEVGGAPAHFKLQILTVDPSELAQSLHERRQICLPLIARCSSVHEHANPLRLLGPCRQRPGRSRGAEEGEEGGAVHGGVHSITSSARPRSVSGKVMPSTLATIRLRTSSTFTDCCTGKSAGLSPLRMRPTYVPARRSASILLAP